MNVLLKKDKISNNDKTLTIQKINDTKKQLSTFEEYDFYKELIAQHEELLKATNISKEDIEQKFSKIKQIKSSDLKKEKLNSQKYIKKQLELKDERIIEIKENIDYFNAKKKKFNNLFKEDSKFKEDFNNKKIESTKLLKEFRDAKFLIFKKSFKFNFDYLIANVKSIFYKENESKKMSILKEKYTYFSNTIKNYSFQHDLYSKKAKMYLEFEQKFKAKYDEQKQILSKTKQDFANYNSEKNSETKTKDKLKFQDNIKASRKAFISNIIDIYKKWFKRKIKTQALKNKRKAYWYVYKDAIKNSIIYNDFKKIKKNMAQTKSKLRFDFRFLKKELKYQQEHINKSTPIEVFTNYKYVVLILDLIFPGLASLFMKQYKKAILFLSFSGFLYGVVIPLCFGYITMGGDGIFGLHSLGEDVYFGDSRVYIVEGVISLISLTVWLSYVAFSVRNSYKIGVLTELGIRSNEWFASKRVLQKFGLPYIISSPAWLFVIYISMMPVAATFIFAFTNYGGVNNPPASTLEYVGFKNFELLFNPKLQMGEEFLGILWWTIQWTFFTSITTIVLGFILAYLTNHNRIKFKWLWRTIQVLPWAIPGFLMILFWRFLVQSPSDVGANDSGLAWKILSSLGIISETIKVNGATKSNDIYLNVVFAKMFLVFLNAWLASAFMSLFYSGILQGIPKNLYEASKIDGAKSARQIRHITIPLVLIAIGPIIIRQVLQNFNNFGLIWLFTDGGPYPTVVRPSGAGQTDIILSWIYKIVRFPTRVNNGVGFASVAIILVSIFTVTIGAVGTFKSKSIKEGNF